MADEGGGSPPPAGAGQPADPGWLKLTSFDAASFFAKQQREQEELRALQGQQLQAAADLLLPSSSDDDSSSDSEAGSERPVAAERPGQRGGRRGAPRRTSSSPEARRDRKGSKKRRRRGDGKEEERRGKGRKGSKGKRRRHESEREQQVRVEREKGAAQRAAQVKAWAPAKGLGAPQEEYYFDARGDPANVAFGGLYRMDVALYRRLDPASFARSLGARPRWQRYGLSHVPTEADGHAQRDRGSRYFGPSSTRAERSAHLRRWRRAAQQAAGAGAAAGAEVAAAGLLGWGRQAGGEQRAPPASAGRLDLPSPGFLPLEEGEGEEDASGRQQPGPGQGPAAPQRLSAAEELAADAAAAARRRGETNEQLLLRRTREFNVATRERPHDVQLWLEFARFQDEALRLGPARRGGERGAAEKKIAILEKALSLHPGSDELLLALLQAAEAVCDEREVERRWRAVLVRHGGSPRLWRAYLRHRRARFGDFSAADVGEAYVDAVAALRSEHRRRASQGAPADVLAALEAEAAALAVEGAQLRLAAGATEAGVAALLALLEFNFFSPEGWPDEALEAMFEEFWRSGAPLLGQPGGAGWAAWIAGEPGAAPAPAPASPPQPQPQPEPEPEPAGGGWEELAPAFRARFGHALRLDEEEPAADDPAAGQEEEEEEAVQEDEQPVEEETDEQLLERLGVDLEAALEEAAATLDPPLLRAWLAAEAAREAEQWEPRRAEAPSPAQPENEDEAHRTVAWRDVRRLLWRFDSPAARRHLLAGCLRLLGAPLPALPTDGPVAAAAAAGADELWLAAEAAGCRPGCWPGLDGWAAQLLSGGDWAWLLEAGGALRRAPWLAAAASRRDAVQRLLAALVRGPAQHDGELAHALLAVAARSADHGDGDAPCYPAARDLAKQLLAEQRGNLALWHAYAQLEAAAGSAKAARKVYAACFATAAAPTGRAAAAAVAPLVLGAARLELAAGAGGAAASLPPALLAGAGDAAVARAARLLAWLGSGGAVALAAAAAAAAAAPLAQHEAVAAKRGFQDILLALTQQQQQPPGGGGGLPPGTAALVAAAAAFEQVLGRQRGDAEGGVRAALAIFDQVLAALQPPPGPAQQAQRAQRGAGADPQLELLEVQRCRLAVDAAHAAPPALPPRAARDALLRALRRHPASPPLLQLLVAHEAAGHTLTQLRRALHALREEAPSPQVWLAMLAAEVAARSPAAVLRGTLERAVASPEGRACPLLWRCCLRLEASQGRHEAARRAFLRAVGACPWSKALWCDGLALLNGHATPKELSEYIEVMKDKDLTLRTDVFEVALAQLEGEAGGGDGGGGGADAPSPAAGGA